MVRRHWSPLLALLGVAVVSVPVLRLRDSSRQAAVVQSDPETILIQPELRQTALDLGHSVFQAHCANCHAATGEGDTAAGVPDLNSGEHLYGEGRVAEIEAIARHGIRAGDKRGWNLASMPAYASLHPYAKEPLPSLTPHQVEAVTQYLLLFTGRATNPMVAQEGGELFRGAAGCYDCHGRNAEGDSSIGAPSLVDHRWIYGSGSHDDIYRTLSVGRAGVSPAFDRTLSAAELRSVAVYVASLQPTRRQRADVQ